MEYTKENYDSAKPTDVFEFVCQKCGKTFIKTKREIQKNGGVPPKCCSQVCGRKNNDLGFIEVTCAECGNVKNIRVSEYNKSETKMFFCNSSCAAKYNNRKYPKRTKKELKSENTCPLCGKYKDIRGTLCKKCYYDTQHNIKIKELGEYIGYGENRKKYISGKCQDIRRDAKRVLTEDKEHEKVCAYCKNHEFDDILEVHHLKPISSFDEHTKIKEINDKSNLVWLCPNHHAMLEK